MIIASLSLFVTVLAELSAPQTTRLAELTADPTIACYGIAAGRKSTPIRENYLTFSDVVAELPRGSFFLGQRVEGENKVLVMTPTASGAIGIARFSFVAKVDAKKCEGETLFAPAFDTLKGWGEPLPGEAKLPHLEGADQTLHQGCYQAKAGAVVVNGSEKQPLEVGSILFAGDALEGSKMSATLSALDPKSGAVVGTVARKKLERVALSRCAGL